MADLRGTVRYRFRHEEDDVDVVIEGEAVWVSNLVENLELKGVGWTMPIARASRPQNLSGLADDDDVLDEDAPPADLGPAPDPSRIPVVRRPIGQLDLESEVDRIGLQAMQRPDPIELMEVVEGLDRPLPVKDPTSVDPQAEAWLKELMEVVVCANTAPPPCVPRTSKRCWESDLETVRAVSSKSGSTRCLLQVNW